MEKIFEFSLLSGLNTFLDDIPKHILIIVGVITIILVILCNVWLYHRLKSRILELKINEYDKPDRDDNLSELNGEISSLPDRDDNLLDLYGEVVLQVEGLDNLVLGTIKHDLESTQAYSTVVNKEEKGDSTPKNVRTDVLSTEINGKDIPATLKYKIEVGDVLKVVLNSDKNLNLAVALRDFKVNNEALVLENIDPTNLGTKAGDLSKGKSHIEVLDNGIHIEYENLANFRDGFRLKTGGHLTFHFNESYDNFEFSVLFETGDHKHFKDVTVELNPEK